MRAESALRGFACCHTKESSLPLPEMIGYAKEAESEEWESVVSFHSAPVLFERYTFSTPLRVSNQSMFTPPSKVKRIGRLAFPAEVICSGVAATFPSAVSWLNQIDAFSELYQVRSQARYIPLSVLKRYGRWLL